MVYWIKKLIQRSILSKYFVLLLFLVSSCKTFYTVEHNSFNSSQELLANSYILDFKNPVKVNFSGNIDYNKSYKIKGILKYYGTNKFQITVYSSTLGVEIGRLQLLNDTITYIDRINKKIRVSKSLNFGVLKELNINKENILNLLLGRSLMDSKAVEIESNSLNVSYNYNTYKGASVLNRFGYLKSNSLVGNKIFYKVEYSKYSKKYSIPLENFVEAELGSLKMKCNYSISTVNTIKKEQFKAFKLNQSYKLYNE